MSKHTPGPWIAKAHDILKETPGESWLLARCSHRPNFVGTTREANAARIVACVNSLEGVEDVESFVRRAKELMEKYGR